MFGDCKRVVLSAFGLLLLAAEQGEEAAPAWYAWLSGTNETTFQWLSVPTARIPQYPGLEAIASRLEVIYMAFSLSSGSASQHQHGASVQYTENLQLGNRISTFNVVSNFGT